MRIFNFFYGIFYYLLLARIIFSFLPLGRDANPALLKVRRFVYQLTEPVLKPVRNVVKPVHMGSGAYLDLSPLVALLLLDMLRRFLWRL